MKLCGEHVVVTDLEPVRRDAIGTVFAVRFSHPTRMEICNRLGRLVDHPRRIWAVRCPDHE